MCFGKFYDESVLSEFPRWSKAKERIHEVDINVAAGQLFHIIFDVLRVGGDHGAVVVVACLRESQLRS